MTPEQCKILAELESEGKLHVSLVYRGDKENAVKFVEAQEAVLLDLYPPAEEETGSAEQETADQDTAEGAVEASESEVQDTSAPAESEVE